MTKLAAGVRLFLRQAAIKAVFDFDNGRRNQRIQLAICGAHLLEAELAARLEASRTHASGIPARAVLTTSRTHARIPPLCAEGSFGGGAGFGLGDSGRNEKRDGRDCNEYPEHWYISPLMNEEGDDPRLP